MPPMLPFIEPGVSPVDNKVESRAVLSIPDDLERIAALLRRPGALPITNHSTVGELLAKLPADLRDPLLAVLRMRDSPPDGRGLGAIPSPDTVSFCAGVQYALVAIQMGAVSGYVRT